MADIEYEQVINFAKQNGFYDETLDKLSKLISKTSNTVEVYKSLL